MTDVFDSLKAHPALQGWILDADVITSPDGSWGVDRHIITTRGADGAYASLAHRYESALRHRVDDLEDLATLLTAVRSIPVVAGLIERHARLCQEVEHVASARKLAVTLWDFSNPAVRATARHPAGGIVALECILEQRNETRVLTYGWVDDPLRLVRRSWRKATGFDDRSVDKALLLKFVERLAKPPAWDAWEESKLSSAPGRDPYTEGLPELDVHG